MADNLKSMKQVVSERENDRDNRGLDRQSLRHAETSIRHAFNWTSKPNSPNPLIPTTFRPFASVERTQVSPRG